MTRLLFLAANPDSTPPLQTGREVRRIRERVAETARRGALEIIERWAVRPSDLQQALIEVQPEIVHFSGHGSADRELMLEGDDGGARPVSAGTLSELFRLRGAGVRLVVLSACHSLPQAEAIAEHVGCAIGMRRAIGSEAATEFSAALYHALGSGDSVRTAFEAARLHLEAEGIPEHRTPQLVVRRAGVDIDQCLIQAPRSAGSPRDALEPQRAAPPGDSASEPREPGRAVEKKVLWVEDDPFALLDMSFWLTDQGYEVVTAHTSEEALQIVRRDPCEIACVIIDLCFPGPSSPLELPGLRLARSIKKERPGISLLCVSNVVSSAAVEWFGAHGAGYFHKHELGASKRLFMRTVAEAMTGRAPPPATLIVHGKAQRLFEELRRYLSGELGWPDVRAFQEIPSKRRSVVQKLSDEAREADLVFIMLCPEDVTFASAEQIGIPGSKCDIDFELGYFLGSAKQRSSKIVVLTTGGAGVPVPVDDLAVIDASGGLGSALERVRSELKPWLKD